MSETPPNITLVADADGKLDPAEVYDALIGQIDPELVTSEIPKLKAKYKEETPEQRTTRGERYAAAYKEYESMLAQFVGGLKAHAGTQRREALVSAEAQSRKGEEEQLKNMEELFTK